MVEMELINNLGTPYPNAATRVMAYMLFPDDDSDRIDFLAGGAQYTAQNDGQPVPPQVASRVYKLGGEPVLNAKFDRAFKGGATAGGILFLVWRCALHAPKHATLSRARWLATTNMINAPQGGVSDTTVRNAWRKFKPVAHLWAALHVIGDVPSDDNLGDFLGISAFFAKFGMEHRSEVDKAPTALDPNTIIAAPPKLARDVKVDPPPLTSVELSQLEEYTKAAVSGQSPRVSKSS